MSKELILRILASAVLAVIQHALNSALVTSKIDSVLGGDKPPSPK